MHKRIAYLLVLPLVVLLGGGCQTSNNWREFYQRPSANTKAVQFTSREEVQVRVAKLQQFKEAWASMDKYLDERKLAPEDMTPADGKAQRQIELDALRVREDAQSLARLGHSVFTSSNPGRPDDPGLVSFAKSIGADIVVIATEFAGVKQGYERVPVTSYTTSNATANAWGSGGYARGTASGDSYTTSYVPVPVTYQRWSCVAVYWRRVAPDERARLDAEYRPK